MVLRQIIKNSLLLLRERPSMFAPKIAASLISSLWMVSLLKVAESGNLDITLLLMLFFPFIMFLGLVAPVMVAEAVINSISVKQAFWKTFKKSHKIFAATLMLILIFGLASIPLYAGLGLYMMGYSLFVLLFGVLSTAALLIAISFMIYFLPVTLTEKGAVKSFFSSSKASSGHKFEVGVMMLFSFVLLGIAAVSTGPLRTLGFAGFVLGRVASSIVGTYTVVITPNLYAELRD